MGSNSRPIKIRPGTVKRMCQGVPVLCRKLWVSSVQTCQLRMPAMVRVNWSTNSAAPPSCGDSKTSSSTNIAAMAQTSQT